MSIRCIAIDPLRFTSEQLAPAAAWLRDGGVVAYPTDTFYGLAVDPSSSAAVQNLFDLKGRDAKSALPLIAGSYDEVTEACGVMSPVSARLARAWWPGPLSLILEAPDAIVGDVHGGAGTIAVRVPAHALARAFAGLCGGLVTATSANLSGRPPAASVAALETLGNDPRVMIVDGGATAGGSPSTIVDARSTEPRLVRAGAIEWSRVLESLL